MCHTWCHALRQNHPKRESTGTGFVVHDRLILTNAHVVADSTYVLVKRHGSGTKFKAGVMARGGALDMWRKAGEQGEGDGFEGSRGKKARPRHQDQSRCAVQEEGHAA